MAINIDTVYQRVLAIANKEQRGYITPQQFNLFANQVQFDIFEDYFFKLASVEFGQKNNSQYNDVKKITLEKIQPFEVSREQLSVTATHAVLPTNLYRLGEVFRDGSAAGLQNIIIEEVTEKELLEMERSPLATYNLKRPILIRDGANVRVYPQHATDASKQFIKVFTQNGDTDGTDTISVDADGNLNSIEVGQTVSGTDITTGTTVSVITGSGADGLTLSATSTGTSSDVTLTFTATDIKCNYIRRPNEVSWGYTEINSTALYNSASSTDFELHESEENTLVIKILALAGISIKNAELMQVAMAKEQERK